MRALRSRRGVSLSSSQLLIQLVTKVKPATNERGSSGIEIEIERGEGRDLVGVDGEPARRGTELLSLLSFAFQYYYADPSPPTPHIRSLHSSQPLLRCLRTQYNKKKSNHVN